MASTTFTLRVETEVKKRLEKLAKSTGPQPLVSSGPLSAASVGIWVGTMTRAGLQLNSEEANLAWVEDRNIRIEFRPTCRGAIGSTSRRPTGHLSRPQAS